jgi:hypothetical protein
LFRLEDILTLAGAVFAAVLLVVVVRWRRKDYGQNTNDLAQAEVCEHLRPALEHLLAKGCVITRIGQHARDYPLEIHLQPPFDPKAVYEELKLEEPVFLSERNVLYCKEDWCELHPKA